jgi:malonyl-CoA/methylmalonyl-CoA synthetase
VTVIPTIAAAPRHTERTAVIAEDGHATYGQLLDRSAAIATSLLGTASDLAGAHVAFLVSPGIDWVAALWGIWRAGGVATPLAASYPPAELEYVVRDSEASLILADPGAAARLRPIATANSVRLASTIDSIAPSSGALPNVSPTRDAMLVYPSGTTSAPKGVVTTHAALAAQIASLHEAWEWTPDDRILNVLPLHHVHGIMAVVGAALAAGATCDMMHRFDADAVWRRFCAAEPLTLFMAVPTIYGRLISAWEAAPPATQAAMSRACHRLRLMVSGSAALPVPTLERWRAISGHTLLERYGMTEFGLALSNPVHGERRPGWVGSPLPGVAVRVVGADGADVPDGEPGELLVRGPAVFREYWRRPEETAAAFTPEGWFHTGDVGERRQGWYRILGRTSVDIIKTGGYKVSALEVEHVLLAHDAVDQCAVVGVPDDDWGERVTAAVVLHPGHSLTLEVLRAWATDRLAPYKIPRHLTVLDELPRNAMGKVTKPALVRYVQNSDPEATS